MDKKALEEYRDLGEFLEDKILTIYQDFTKQLESMESICVLKDLNYENKDCFPDYSNTVLQQLYLLRYLYAYVCEYCHIYKVIIDLKFIDIRELKIVSLGCGNYTDLYGLYFANEVKNKIVYTGLDNIDWNYKWPAKDIKTNYLTKITELAKHSGEINVIIFPMSICEFKETEIKTVVDLIAKKILENRIHLIVTFRSTRSEKDKSAFKLLLEMLQKYDFIEIPELKKEFQGKKQSYKYINYEKIIKDYPDLILEENKNIKNKCRKINDCAEFCSNDLGIRKPMLTRWMSWEIVSLKRKK